MRFWTCPSIWQPVTQAQVLSVDLSMNAMPNTYLMDLYEHEGTTIYSEGLSSEVISYNYNIFVVTTESATRPILLCHSYRYSSDEHKFAHPLLHGHHAMSARCHAAGARCLDRGRCQVSRR